MLLRGGAAALCGDAAICCLFAAASQLRRLRFAESGAGARVLILRRGSVACNSEQRDECWLGHAALCSIVHTVPVCAHHR